MRAPSAIALVTVTLMSCGSAYAKHPKPREPSEFENAEIRVEQNATDGDTEVVIFAKGGDDGFKHFRVGSPDRRIVVATFSLDRTVRGQRELLFESPEPPGEAILAAYPEGSYRFDGVTHKGERFAGTARLSHELPPATVILSPADGASIGSGPLLGLVDCQSKVRQPHAWIFTAVSASICIRPPSSSDARLLIIRHAIAHERDAEVVCTIENALLLNPSSNAPLCFR
jgi:hypothetical protein